LHTSAVAFQLFKILGVLYLAYLAWGMWKESGSIQIENRYSDEKYSRITVQAFLINILNPKLSIFILAFLPQFVLSGAASPVSYMLLLSGIFMLMTLIIFIGYGVLANQVRHYISQSPKVVQSVQRVFSGLFVAGCSYSMMYAFSSLPQIGLPSPKTDPTDLIAPRFSDSK